MHKTHLPLTIWFWAIYRSSGDKRGISATQLAAELDLSYESAWYLLYRIRKAMGQREHNYFLSGITELDDTYYGGTVQGSKRGRGTDKMKIMVALSKSKDGRPKYLKMQVMDCLKGETVGTFAKANIEYGSAIQSDGYHSYRKPLADGYDHQFKLFDSNTEMLHWLHIVVGNMKTFLLGTYHGNCKKNLQMYLNEFCYRFNRRAFKDELFSRLLHAVTESNILGVAV
jgi:transposase-like protein